MHLEPIADLNWAYQLRFYLCFRTHWRIAFFESDDRAVLLSNGLNEICRRHDYHLLRSKVYPDHVRCLVSLRPDQEIAKATQTIKSNSSRDLFSPWEGCSTVGSRLPG
jgi:REP element-mobilizing transposase RayT